MDEKILAFDGVVAVLAILAAALLFMGFELPGSMFGNRIDASDAVALDKLQYSYGEPIIISFRPNPNPAPAGGAPDKYHLYSNYFAEVAYNSMVVSVDGQQLNKAFAEASIDQRLYGANPIDSMASNAPFSAVKLPHCYASCQYGSGSDKCDYVCTHFVPATKFDPSDSVAKIYLPQYLQEGTHELTITWQGQYGCLALTQTNPQAGVTWTTDCVGQTYNVVRNYKAQSMFAQKNFTVTKTAYNLSCGGTTDAGSCLNLTVTPCAPGAKRIGDYCVYSLAQPASGAAALAEAQGNVRGLQQILTETQSQLSQVQSEISSLKETVASINSALQTAQTAIASLNSQIASLKATVISTQAELAEVKASLQAVDAKYAEVSAALELTKTKQTATQTSLDSALASLTAARDANLNYRISLDDMSAKLTATNLLTVQQQSEITSLRGIVMVKEGIANQSLILAAQKDVEAQTALNEVYRVMQEKSVADAAYRVQMDATIAKLNDASSSLSEKIAAFNDLKAQLDAASANTAEAQAQLAAANSALTERQAALAQAQADMADLQKSYSDVQSKLNEATGATNIWMILAGIAIIVLVSGAIYWYVKLR